MHFTQTHSAPPSINCRGRLVVFDRVHLMGILNLTPDSFYDGGKHNTADTALKQTEQLLREGADMIDVGGMSSRPGAKVISEEKERKRVVPVIKKIAKEFPEAILSIDTVHGSVARAAVEAGAHLVNDISMGRIDKNLLPTVSELGVPYILMHLQGKSPGDMQDNPSYRNVTMEVLDSFLYHIGVLRSMGVKDILLDPGFGFGKTVEHNYTLLRELSAFQILDLPILAGLSRKSMICKPLNIDPEQALNGTTALHVLAIQNGAHLLRVHDVKEAKEVVKLMEQVRGGSYFLKRD